MQHLARNSSESIFVQAPTTSPRMEVHAFEQQLLRLKRMLGVSADGEVAKALGMSKAAFSERKRRNAFPKDKLLALAGLQPELKLDAIYVLTGIPTSAPTTPESGRAAVQKAVFEQLRQDLSVDEQLLLEAYRALDDRAKKRLLSQVISAWSHSSKCFHTASARSGR
ncbi:MULTISPECIES: helix-turn-helix domain-containing protein [Variovorax]|uniref:helix-turn-helix domain-containing protein n=1 Tax=Variovorax TaxID=34072 RepID=UPI001C431554|nr:helix-turn-helix domain-containing protein [Variovorax sp. OV084]